MTDTDSVSRTKTAARILGPYLVVMAATLLVRAEDMTLLFPGFMQDGPLVFATGAFALIAGLTLVALHHHFTSPAAIAVSVIGIGAAVKAASLMIAPTIGAALTHAFVSNVPMLTVAALLVLLLGLWLSFVGWIAKASS